MSSEIWSAGACSRFFGIVLGLAVSLAMAGTQKSIRLPGDHALAKLKPGPGVEVVRANCAACHSTDYVVLQPGGDAKQWDAEVKKMITVYGAPITEADTKKIVEYLVSAYGPQKQSTPSERKRPARRSAR